MYTSLERVHPLRVIPGRKAASIRGGGNITWSNWRRKRRRSGGEVDPFVKLLSFCIAFEFSSGRSGSLSQSFNSVAFWQRFTSRRGANETPRPGKS